MKYSTKLNKLSVDTLYLYIDHELQFERDMYTYQVEGKTAELHCLEDAVSDFFTHPRRHRFVRDYHCYRTGPEPTFTLQHTSH